MMKLEGCSCIVTGGAGLLGTALCEALLAKKAKVCIADTDEVKAKELASELQQKYGADNVIYLKLDVTDESSLRSVYEETCTRLGTVNVLVNNAAMFNDKAWSKMVDVNLKGVIGGTLLGLEKMGKDKGGQGGAIINISSGSAFNYYCPMPTYSATKAAISAFTMCWSHRWHFENHGVRLNVVVPTLIHRPESYPLKLEGQYFRERMVQILTSANTPEYTVSAIKVGEAVVTVIEEDRCGETVKVDKNGMNVSEKTPFFPPEDMPREVTK